MAEHLFFPFESGDGSFLNESRWTDLFSWMRTVGVLSEDTVLAPDGELAVNALGEESTEVKIEDGEAFIQGFYFRQTEGPEIVGIPLNDTSDPRIDLLVLRLDKPNDSIYFFDIEGTPDPSPVVPDPIQNSTIWDLPLAEIYVAAGAPEIFPGDITDVRVRSMQGDGGSSAVTLASAGGTTLVSDGVGPDLEVKGLTAGTNITLTPSGTAITIEATGAGSSVTLANAGTTSLVNDGVGPDLATKGLVAGTDISFSTSATDVTINSTAGAGVTLTNAGTTSLVNDGTGPALANKGLVAGTNITFSTSATDVTITGSSTPSNSPICVLRRNANLTVNNASSPIITWTTAVTDPYSMWNGTTTITIAEDGWYAMTVNITWTGDASANGSLLAYTTKVGTRLAESRVMMVGTENVSNNLTTIANLVATDAITVVVTNNTGVNLTMPTGGSYTPVFSLWKIRS